MRSNNSAAPPSAGPKSTPPLTGGAGTESNTSSALSNAQNNNAAAVAAAAAAATPGGAPPEPAENAPGKASVERKRSSGQLQVCRELQGLLGGMLEVSLLTQIMLLRLLRANLGD